MEPYKAKKMPLEYKIDKEMLMLISEANVKYGEYKSLLNTLEFDAGFFLDSVILNESYKSTQIEGTQISQDEMYYLKYMEITDDSREIQNLKKTIEYASSNLQVENKMIKKVKITKLAEGVSTDKEENSCQKEETVLE